MLGTYSRPAVTAVGLSRIWLGIKQALRSIQTASAASHAAVCSTTQLCYICHTGDIKYSICTSYICLASNRKYKRTITSTFSSGTYIASKNTKTFLRQKFVFGLTRSIKKVQCFKICQNDRTVGVVICVFFFKFTHLLK